MQSLLYKGLIALEFDYSSHPIRNSLNLLTFKNAATLVFFTLLNTSVRNSDLSFHIVWFAALHELDCCSLFMQSYYLQECYVSCADSLGAYFSICIKSNCKVSLCNSYSVG